MKSFVHLVGSGPGDPELLTVKALRLLQNADVIVYDKLVSEEILSLIPSSVVKHFAGKESGNHHLQQSEINKLLVDFAKQGFNVVRLKGGDPFVFGRGGEEALYLARHNIPFEIVPGLTAAVACSAYAGIPLTHRGLANSVRFITGHCKDDLPLNMNWRSFADKETTLVIYMGLSNIDKICRNLISAGRSAKTPAAIVQAGTTAQQQSYIATLDSLARIATFENIQSPALTIVGEVVRLADELEWFVPFVEKQLSFNPYDQSVGHA